MLFYAQEATYRALAMEVMGSSLEDLLSLCGGSFSLKTVCMLGIQMITRDEAMHAKGLLHRDIKPANILIGKSPKSKGPNEGVGLFTFL
jgi:serine/threonine protein kinase